MQRKKESYRRGENNGQKAINKNQSSLSFKISMGSIQSVYNSFYLSCDLQFWRRRRRRRRGKRRAKRSRGQERGRRRMGRVRRKRERRWKIKRKGGGRDRSTGWEGAKGRKGKENVTRKWNVTSRELCESIGQFAKWDSLALFWK